MGKKSRGLFDYEYQLKLINAHRPPLQRLNEVIEWEMFRSSIELTLYVEPKAPGGRPPFDRLMMFKILILQRYYNLSDEQTEFQIKDRMSFQQFLGLQIGDVVPDEKTIWLFKEQLKEKKLIKPLFELFTKTLSNKGMMAREGSIVDTSFVNAPKQRNSREENATIKKGETPESFKENPAKLAQKDCDARWTTKNKETHYGYKNHVNVDMKSKLITKYTTTSANIHDSQATEELLNEEDSIAYADSAYRSEKIETYLASVQCTSHIHEKGYRNHPLDIQQQLTNTMKSKIRVRVEHTFGFMTNSMNNGLNLTYNLFRYEQILRLQKIKVM